MKYTIYLITILSFANCKGQTTDSTALVGVETENYGAKHHNKLDDINSAKEIKTILTSISKDYSTFKINSSLIFHDRYRGWSDKECQYFSDSLKIKPWTKCDFDGNGYTDLLVVGNWYSDPFIICIMDNGGDKFFTKRITRRSFQDCTFPIVAIINNDPVILYYSRTEPDWRNHKTEWRLKVDTLVFRFGDFIEVHKTTANHKIERIEYSTEPCFGTCPIFGLTIHSDRTAIFNAKACNKQKGEFAATIDTANFNLLINLLNYIDFPNLDSNYAVHWTDDQRCTLKITYDNGKIMAIKDYGLIGTYGLNRVYDILFKLRENQEWKKIN